MTDVEIAQAAALSRCKFSPGSTAKRFVGWAAALPPDRKLTEKATAFLDSLAHQYRKQIGKCMSVACTTCHKRPTDPDEVRVALDAFIAGHDTGLATYGARIQAWIKAALALYNATNGTKLAHLYEYATRCAPSARRAKTLGEVYCRICGEQLAHQIKQPHSFVKESSAAQRHITICALTLLCGMRKPAKPGYRTMPMEDLWRDDEVPR